MIVTSIATGHWLNKPAALSWFRMVRDANGAVKSSEINDAGRTYEEQVRLFTSRYSQVNTGIDYRFWDGKPWWRKVGVASAATPGTSNHETGNALDVTGGTRTWIRTYGAKYGWIKDRVANEPWHIEYIASRDTLAGQGDDGVSVEEVRVGVAGLLDEAANRSTPTGRAVGNDIIAIIAPLVKTIVAQTWATTVARGTTNIPVLQEVADTKTLAQQINAAIGNLSAGGGSSSIDVEALIAQVRAAVRETLAEGAQFDVNVEVVPKP